jgi:hypothetical protein
MPTVKELCEAISTLESDKLAVCYMLANKPDFEVSTKRLQGEKYTVCVWFRNSGIHLLSHRYSNTETKQKDNVNIFTDAEKFANQMNTRHAGCSEFGPMWFDVLARIQKHNQSV